MGTAAIRLEQVTRDFGSVRALDGLSLEVPAGIVFGFLGPNGSGKTTTIRILLGLLAPTGGRAQVLGFDQATQSDQIRACSGALLEHSGLYPRLSAEDNLEYYARIWRLPPAERRARAQELLTHAGLWDRRRELVEGWSQGMRQKLAIARALLHRPTMVFLDEPTAGLDPVAAASLREDLAGLAAREGATVFLTTHNLHEAQQLCAQVAVIRQGKLVAAGTPDELCRNHQQAGLEVVGRGFTEALLAELRQRPEVASAELEEGVLYLALREEASAAPLVRAIVTSGAEVEEVRRVRATLEEAFLALMEEDADG